MKTDPCAYDDLTAAAKAVLAVLFRDDKTTVTMGNKTSELGSEAAEAMKELIHNKFVLIEPDTIAPTVVYRLTVKGQLTQRNMSLTQLKKHGSFPIWQRKSA